MTGSGGLTAGVPDDIAGLRTALISQREYTLGLYAELPQRYWQSADFPYLSSVNPPLWELAHIAWFQEFFALRWRVDDIDGARTPSCLDVADRLFDSRSVAHADRWRLTYPSKATCEDYMRRALDKVIAALEKSDASERYGFQLVVLHEDMHAEALAMTLATLGLPLPEAVSRLADLPLRSGGSGELGFAASEVLLGDLQSGRTFAFDNECPPQRSSVAAFSIDARVVSAAEFGQFCASGAYSDRQHWTDEGNRWRERGEATAAAMHINYFEAEAYCNWRGRRLPTEVEWELAATKSPAFFASTGAVWEWTASTFLPYPGFRAARYREYSEPWFSTESARYQVLKGGSFLTHARLKYPQYRNFYTSDRRDMFCGFRTCAKR